MTKKILFSIAMFLLAILAFAKNDLKPNQNQPTKVNPITTEIDTVGEPSVSNDSITNTDGSFVVMINSANDKQASQIITVDDDEYILHQGHAYILDDMFDNDYDFNKSHVEMLASEQQVVPVLAICFIVPCVTLLIALAFLLVFFMKKSRDRNTIIEKAIDANYPLPDAFYSNQQPNTYHDNQFSTGMDDNLAGNSDSHKNTIAQRPPRDPKTFSSAVTLLAVGFALILFFAINEIWPAAMLAGGIPFFLGIGKLIGYYYVPGFSSSNRTHNNAYPQPPYTPQYPSQNRPPYPTSGQGQQPNVPYNGSYPPPYNPTKHDSQLH